VLVSARAPDGVVEALELPELPFAVGVQWHPEAVGRHEPRHLALYRGLVEAARERVR
jgi:putative glutamine amidotransferase